MYKVGLSNLDEMKEIVIKLLFPKIISINTGLFLPLKGMVDFVQIIPIRLPDTLEDMTQYSIPTDIDELVKENMKNRNLSKEEIQDLMNTTKSQFIPAINHEPNNNNI
jgi:hypothetical protein